MHRENTWTPFGGAGGVWGQPQGGAGIPQPQHEQFSTAALPGQDTAPKAWCCPVSKAIPSLCWVRPALGLEPERFFFRRKFHIWEGKDEAFKKVSLPAKESSYRSKGEENISWVTEFCPALPEGTNSYIIFHTPTQLSQKCRDPPQKLSRRPWDVQQLLCCCCSPLLQPLQRGKGNRTLPRSLIQ